MVKCYSESQIQQFLESYLSLFQSQWGDDRDFYCEDIQKRIFQYEKDILAAFGLPLNSDCYLFLFDKATLCLNQYYDLQWLYKQLSTKADSYFQHDCVIEKQGVNADPFIVLPELGVPVNSYTVFLYNQMSHHNISQKTVWNEFNILKTMNRIVEIYLLCFDEYYHKNPLFHKLIDEGFRLLPAYLKWYHNHRKFVLN